MIERIVFPIYNGNGFNGSGFIIGEYLITASHVVNDNLFSSYYICNGKKKKLNKLLYKEYRKDDGSIAEDLAIYQVEPIDNNIGLETDLFVGDSILGEMFGFSWDEGIDKLSKDSGTTKIYKTCRSLDNNILDNCYSTNSSIAKSGNSGCPFVMDDKVVGMFIRNQYLRNGRLLCDMLIRSTYISLIVALLGSDKEIERVTTRIEYNLVRTKFDRLIAEATEKGMLESEMDNEYTREISRLCILMADYEDNVLKIFPLRER